MSLRRVDSSGCNNDWVGLLQMSEPIDYCVGLENRRMERAESSGCKNDWLGLVGVRLQRVQSSGCNKDWVGLDSRKLQRAESSGCNDDWVGLVGMMMSGQSQANIPTDQHLYMCTMTMFMCGIWTLNCLSL